MVDLSTNIGLRSDRLRQLRDQKGWSQRELARRCKVSDSMIGKYEGGENDPTGFILKSLAEQLEVSTDYLLGLTDDPHIQVRESELTSEERMILEAFRHNGWPAVIRLGGERLSQ